MNKMKKIGLTALATSLVASSAFAGEATVSGSVGYTWATTGGNTGTPGNDHGKGFGTDNSLAFNYSGDLDNGWSVSGYTTLQDAFSLTSSAVTLTMGDMGSITSGSGWGGVSASFDEEIPHAYEQADDGSATSTSMNLVGSKNDNGGIQYKAPTIEMAGATVALQLGYTPKATDSHTTGGAVLTSDTFGSGQDAGVTISHESGLTLGVYASERSRVLVSSTATDEFTGTWYAKYAMGPVTIGYQESYYDPGLAPASDGTAANTAKTLGTTGSGIFTAEGYSIAFNVNDDLSVSYAKVEDTYDAQAGWTSGAVTGDKVADVSLDIKSIQAAYSMGSMSVKMYRTESDNNSYITNGGSRTKNEIALGISF